ncbi:unnamed protein product [Aureobasidium uvarum]|uniref:H/ACA ribonucleoprotein complex subunit n=1 Tax=Aureobasidium uvarum TaxID=2773716 RepID=A0A9N8PNS5_9PEZI|nr:unnamed protein product [Aureobasidium uvarum]
MGTFMHASEGEMVCTSTNVKIPYFNAPIYLENKTAVGKVDEILGPINQVYFTIKPQEGIVATSFKNGDKFYIGGDKLLPLERYFSSSRQTCCCNPVLTLSPDSCPSPSLLPVLPRSRSPQAVAVLVAVSVTAEVVVAVEVQEADSEAVAVRASVAVEAQEVDSVTVVAVDSRAVEAREVSVAVVVAVVVVVAEAATKNSCLDTKEKCKHVGVNRQWRHGVMRPWTAWEMVHKEALFRKRGSSSHVLRCTGLLNTEKTSKKKLFQLHSF